MVYSFTGLSRSGENTTFMERSEFATFGTLGYEIDYIAEAEKYYSYLPVIEKMLSADSFVIKPTGLYPHNSSGLLFDSPIIDLAVNPSTHKVYLSSDIANKVYVLDELTGRMLTNITVNGLPNYVSVHPSANKIYVVSPEFNQIYVINGYTDNITSIIKVGRNPAQLALDPTDYTSSGSKGLLFVANRDDNDVWIIDASTEVLLEKVPLGNLPYGIAVNPVTTRAYVTSLNELSVIDYSYKNHTVFSKVIARVNLLYPVGIAVDPYKNHVFVGSQSGNVSEIDGVTNKVIKNFRVGILPQYLAFNTNTSELYITDSGNNTISILNVSQSSLKPISIDGTPSDIDVDPINNWILTSSARSKSISFTNGFPPHNRMVHVGFDTNPFSSVQIKCNDKIVPMLKIVKVEVGSTCTVEKLKDFDFSGWSKRLRNNVVEFSQPKFENSTYFPSNSTFVSDNTTIRIEENSILTANYHHRDTFVDWIERLGPVFKYNFSRSLVIVIASISQYCSVTEEREN